MPGQTYPIEGLYTKEPESDYLNLGITKDDVFNVYAQTR